MTHRTIHQVNCDVAVALETLVAKNDHALIATTESIKQFVKQEFPDAPASVHEHPTLALRHSTRLRVIPKPQSGSFILYDATELSVAAVEDNYRKSHAAPNAKSLAPVAG